jgi:hypothetical protein
MLVFVGDSEEEELRAAAAATSCGFQRTMVLTGGLQQLSAAGSSGGGGTGVPAAAAADLRFIGRDALAVLLGMSPDVVHAPQAALVDVRRSDERALYGSIKGAAHIPGGVGRLALLVLLLLGWNCQAGWMFVKGHIFFATLSAA